MFYRKQNNSGYLPSDINTAGDVADGNLKKDIRELVASIQRDNTTLLLKDSFVVAIYGAWGTGKTYAAHLFTKHLHGQTDFKNKKLTKEFWFDLLSFGNINESVSNILTNIGKSLFDAGIADVRAQLQQMILDATPKQNINATLSVFGLAFTKKISISSKSKTEKAGLKEQFSLLASKGYRFIVILDDLDRMKPSEVIIVLRMVENFRKIPGIIFVLPFHKVPVAKGISKELNLEPDAAYVFLRKFIKASITIRLGIKDLKSSFVNDFNAHYNAAFAIPTLTANLAIAEQCWYIMMHVILVQETLGYVVSQNQPLGQAGSVIGEEIRNPMRSGYLNTLYDTLHESTQNRENDLDKEYFAYKANGILKPIYRVFPGWTSEGGEIMRDFMSLLKEDVLSGYIWTRESEVHSEMKTILSSKLQQRQESKPERERLERLSPRSVDDSNSLNQLNDENNKITEVFNQGPQLEHRPEYDSQNRSTVFEHLLLPALKNAEILDQDYRLTEYFSRRDMEQLASAFAESLNSVMPSDPQILLKRLIVKAVALYREFK